MASEGETVKIEGAGSYIVAVKNCARCHQDHDAVQFLRLRHPLEVSGMTHWAKCPVTGEPIMGKQIDPEV
jgi:hypothetical protein